MSLFNFSGEGVNYNPLRGLVRELREANKRGDEEDEGNQAERDFTGKGVSRMAGEEMEERMSRTRKERLGRGMSILNQVSVLEEREGKRCCCICQ